MGVGERRGSLCWEAPGLGRMVGYKETILYSFRREKGRRHKSR